MDPENSPEERSGPTPDGGEDNGPPAVRPFWLVLAVMALGLTAVILALVLFGPQNRRPDGRLAPPERITGPRASGGGHPAARDGFLYEEHLGREPGSGGAAPPSEVRGRVAPPPEGIRTPGRMAVAGRTAERDLGGGPGRQDAPRVTDMPGRPGAFNESVAPGESGESGESGGLGGLGKPSRSDVPHESGESGVSGVSGERGGTGRNAEPPEPRREGRAERPEPERDRALGAARGARGAGPGALARLVIVIDDLGDSLSFATELLDLPFPVTLAVMPHRSRSRAVAELAGKRGAEILLHQPMQPRGYPGTDPGQGALLVGQTPERMRRILVENLAQAPGATGVNNHMGSRLTESERDMAVVLEVLAAKGLFFLDSLTTERSAVPRAAEATGAALYRRSVFLDNARSVRSILGQLEGAERLAKKTGRAVAIGHPYPETLSALKAFAASRDTSVAVTTLAELGPEQGD